MAFESMQVNLEIQEGLSRCMKIELPWELVKDNEEKEYTKLKQTYKMDGFRKGKVPLRVLKQRFGDSIRHEVLGTLMRESFMEALKKEDLEPVGFPNFEPKENPKEGEAFEYSASFEIFPAIELKELAGVEVEKIVSVVEDSDLNEALEAIRKQRTAFEKVNRASQDGDKVIIDFEGSIDGVLFEGGSAEGFEVVLGSGQAIPGFESGLEGKKAGEDCVLKVSFPEDYHAKQLAGKPAEFKTKVKEVQASKLPELDEEFVKSMGVESGAIADLKVQVKDGMMQELDRLVMAKLKDQALDKLLELNTIDLPKTMLEREVKRLQDAAHQQMHRQAPGADHDHGAHDHPELADENFKEPANRNVTLGLLFRAAIDKYDLKPDSARVDALVENRLAMFGGTPEMKQFLLSNEQVMESIKHEALEEQLVEKLLETAVVKEVTKPYIQVMKPEQHKDA